MDKLDLKTKVVICIVLLAVGFGSGYFSKPTSVVTEIKEVVKTVTVKEEAKTKVVYKDRIVHPDGTIEEHERSQEQTNTREASLNESSKTSNTETKNDVGLTLQALAIVDIKDITGTREYGIYVKKRIFSNISVGAIITTDKKIGAGIGLDF
jgi:hypothetical protein